MSFAPLPPLSRLAATEAVAAVVFNLIPIVGVLFWGWSPFALIFLYWTENVLIGARTMVSLLTVGVLRGLGSVAGAASLAAFFTVHYGMFCFVHGVFVVSMFGADSAGTDSFNLVAVAASVFAKQESLAIGFASIAIWQLVEYALFLFREAKSASLHGVMMAPYPRIVLLHVTIIFGGFLLMLTGWPVIGVAALALFKLAYDVAFALGWSPLRMALALREERERPRT